MDSTTPATAQQQDATTATPNFDTLAMVTAAAAVANNTNLNMAAALLTAPNPHFLNALNSAFPLYSVAGATNILNAIVATNTAPLQPTVTPQTATAGSSFLNPVNATQQTAFTNLLSTNACSCTTFPPQTTAPQNHPAIQTNEDRPTPSNFLRSSRKRTLAESGIRSSSNGSATRQPSAKYQRVATAGRRPDTPTPLISDAEQRIQPPPNLTDNFLDSVVSAAFSQQQQEQQSAAAMSRAINLNSRNLSLLQQQQNQQPSPQLQQQGPNCPVCHNRPTVSPAVAALQQANAALQTTLQTNVALATSSQTANLLPPAPPTAFVTFPQPTPTLQLPTVDESPGNACMCTGFHCARCNGTDRQNPAEDFNSWLSRSSQANAYNQSQLSQLNAAAANGSQIPNELFALALNRVHQQFQQVGAPVPQPPQRLRYPQATNQFNQQQLAFLQSSVSAAANLNRSLQHQMTRASSLSGASPFPAAATLQPAQPHPDHINLLNRRQQSQNATNDYINRFYSQNQVVLPQPPQQQSVQLPQLPQVPQPQTGAELQGNPFALRAARLAPQNPASNLTPYHQANHSLLLLSNIHNIHHQLAASDMPMIFFPASTNGDYVLGNPEAVTHAVATAMHHAPEPQPVGASSDQIKRCTQIRNYVKDLEVPENERERCTVCLMDFETGEDIRTLHCSHMFHIDCIDRWLAYNKKCPVCRVDMDKIPVLITDNEEEALGLAAAAQ